MAAYKKFIFESQIRFGLLDFIKNRKSISEGIINYRFLTTGKNNIRYVSRDPNGKTYFYKNDRIVTRVDFILENTTPEGTIPIAFKITGISGHPNPERISSLVSELYKERAFVCQIRPKHKDEKNLEAYRSMYEERKLCKVLVVSKEIEIDSLAKKSYPDIEDTWYPQI
ncbi:MAG: hypothetical protein HZB65_04105 [Candidatus Aenigmarchaeota archaeon]|nr:hypothetical protein [Candidatus Aenigmarchaeota archaeon]